MCRLVKYFLLFWLKRSLSPASQPPQHPYLHLISAPPTLIGRSVRVLHSYWWTWAAGRTYWWSCWGCHGHWQEVGGQAQQRMGQVGVGEARGEGRVVEADCCWHWYVRPLDTGEVLATSPRGSNLRCLLNVLFQLLHVPLKLGSSVLEPTNYLKYQKIFK